jgi:hypothetical protein
MVRAEVAIGLRFAELGLEADPSRIPEVRRSERVLEEGWILHCGIITWRNTHAPTEVTSIGAEFDRAFDPTG